MSARAPPPSACCAPFGRTSHGGSKDGKYRGKRQAKSQDKGQKGEPEEADHRSWKVFPYFVVTACVVSVGVCAFAYMVAYAPPNVQAKLEISDPKCSWWQETKRLNPFGCFRPSFTTSEKLPSHTNKPLGACNGALVEDLFGRYSGSDGALDLNEAKELAGDVLGRTFNAASCGQSTSAPAEARACFTHATHTKSVAADDAGKYVGCLLGHETPACRGEICTT